MSKSDISPIMKLRRIILDNRVKIEWYIDSKYYKIIVDGFIIALCPSEETAIFTAKGISQHLKVKEN